MIRFLFISILAISFFFPSENDSLLMHMYKDNDWTFIEEEEGITIYMLKNSELPIIRLDKNVTSTENLFSIVLDIQNYNNIFSDRTISTEYLFTRKDTIYGYQIVKNLIPFTRNRHMIFKIYHNGVNRLDWQIIDENSELYLNYKSIRNKELTYGGGSWRILEEGGKKKIRHYFFIDPKVKMPMFFLNSARKRSVLQAFKDVLNILESVN